MHVYAINEKALLMSSPLTNACGVSLTALWVPVSTTQMQIGKAPTCLLKNT